MTKAYKVLYEYSLNDLITLMPEHLTLFNSTDIFNYSDLLIFSEHTMVSHISLHILLSPPSTMLSSSSSFYFH